MTRINKVATATLSALLALAFIGSMPVSASEITGTLSSSSVAPAAPAGGSGASGSIGGSVTGGSVISGSVSGGSGGGGGNGPIIAGSVTGGTAGSGGGGGSVLGASVGSPTGLVLGATLAQSGSPSFPNTGAGPSESVGSSFPWSMIVSVASLVALVLLFVLERRRILAQA